MCGIAGLLSYSLLPMGNLFKMTAVQSHRGPDGYGHLFVNNDSCRFLKDAALNNNPAAFLSLGHRRLSIIDCSEAGTQPMVDSSGMYWITFNGEVYNYLELRKKLEKEGAVFQTSTDTEVVLTAYRHWGVDCFSRFNGMWGLAIWDARKDQLVLSRDRFGVKPLHYAKAAKGLVFASEIKGVLASGWVEAKLSAEIAFEFLKWGMTNHRDDTFFQGVHAFPPGCYAIINPSSPNDIKPVSYWHLQLQPENKMSLNEAAAKFNALFQSSIDLRLRSDVPVGSCLSGGLDSSAIVCSAVAGGNLVDFSTFTASAEDPRFDETYWADLVNKFVHADSHFVVPSEEGFLKELELLLWHQEEPFTTTSIYAQWCIMRQARDSSVPVLLDGQGADEALCGYRKFVFFYLKEMISRNQWGKFLSEMTGLLRQGDRGLLRWREGKRYLPAFMRSKVAGLEQALNSSYETTWLENILELGRGYDVRQRQVDDITRFSVPSLLRYEDRNSMAHSIESRVPFLDYRLVEFLVNLPADVKIKHGVTKAVMRRALDGKIPAKVLNRRDKMGFTTAQELWMHRLLGEQVKNTLFHQESRISEFFDMTVLHRMWQDFTGENKGLSSSDFFRLFIFNNWLERFDVSS